MSTVEELSTKMMEMQNEIDQLKSSMGAIKKPKKVKSDRPPRPPSVYNLFMKENLPKIKVDNPGIGHKEAFQKVADLWKLKKQEQ